MALVSADKGLQVFFGNTNVTQLDPEYREFDSSIDHVGVDRHYRAHQFPDHHQIPQAVLEQDGPGILEGEQAGQPAGGALDRKDLGIRSRDDVGQGLHGHPLLQEGHPARRKGRRDRHALQQVDGGIGHVGRRGELVGHLVFVEVDIVAEDQGDGRAQHQRGQQTVALGDLADHVKHRASVTDPKDVTRLLRFIDGYTGSFVVRCALRLAPLVFVRPGELRHAEWSEIDLDKAEWRIPAEKMKMREQHIVPLSAQSLAILRELHPLTGAGKYVFPGRGAGGTSISENAINAALRYLGYTKDEMTGHGFRSMRSAKIKPGIEAHALLRTAPTILCALDADAAGCDGWLWWQAHYSQARRWLPLGGKDPGEAMAADERCHLPDA